MTNYRVIVGNIGCVYEGDNVYKAQDCFSSYVECSQRLHNRATGEPVLLFEDDEVKREHNPSKGDRDA